MKSDRSFARAIALAETGLVPDALVRLGIRRMLAGRLRELTPTDADASEALPALLAELRHSPIAPAPDLANQQHYALPAAFFAQVLGPRLKYSCGLWPEGVSDLASAEERMLALTCVRARLQDGMSVLDLGCGWGSLSLWIAERFPRCRVFAVSNSKLQGEFIAARAAERGLENVGVSTADINSFRPEGSFDRVVSVEMFEHVRNYELLLARIATWLEPGGKLFVHLFCHRAHAYPYRVRSAGDWMARHFFSEGLMPSDDLLLHFQRDVELERRWRVGGMHYHWTCEAWLRNLDERREAVLPLLAATYGAARARLWLQRWRMFLMACSELFGHADGDEWGVSHYLFAPRAASRT